jgi:SnoaL-like domain
MRRVVTDDKWLKVLDPDSPPWMVAMQRELVDAYVAGDLGWVLDHTHPDIEIVQPPEFPDARTYRGLEGLVDAFLDWPNEWEDFEVEPTRIHALDDELVMSKPFTVDARRRWASTSRPRSSGSTGWKMGGRVAGRCS